MSEWTYAGSVNWCREEAVSYFVADPNEEQVKEYKKNFGTEPSFLKNNYSMWVD